MYSQSVFQQIINHLQEFVLIVDAENVIQFANHAFMGCWGGESKALLGQKLQTIVTVGNPTQRILEKPHFDQQEGQLHNVDGAEHTILVSKNVLDQDAKNFYYVIQDITQIRFLEETIAQEAISFQPARIRKIYKLTAAKQEDYHESLRAYLELGRELLNLETGILSHIENQQYQVVEVVSALSVIQPGDLFELKNTYCSEVAKTQQIVCYIHVGGNESMRGHPVYQNLKLESYISMPLYVEEAFYGTLNFSDRRKKEEDFSWQDKEVLDMLGKALSRIIENELLHEKQKALETQLSEMAIVDELTGAYNRRKFSESFNLILERARRLSEPAALILMDLDHFKEINDQHGHDTGDHILRQFSQTVKSHIRKIDEFFRYGGEEFALLVNTNVEGAKEISEKIRRQTEQMSTVTNVDLTVSIGVTHLKKEDTEETAFKRADVALYQSKQGGRNQVQVVL